MYIYIYNFNFAKSFINFNPDVGLSKIIQTKPNQNSLYIQNFAENLGLYRDYRKLAQLGFKSTSTINNLWRHCNILRYKVMSFTCTRFCSSSSSAFSLILVAVRAGANFFCVNGFSPNLAAMALI